MSKATNVRKKALELVRQQDWQGAIREYRRLADMDQSNPNVHNELADIYLKTNSKAEAYDAFVRAIDEYTRVGLFNNAVAVAKKVMRVLPARAEVLVLLGNVRVKQGLPREAESHYTSFLERAGGGSLDAAAFKNVARGMLECAPDSVPVLYKLAQCLISFQLDDEAREALLRLHPLLGRNGSNPEMLREVRESLTRLGVDMAAGPAPGVPAGTAGVDGVKIEIESTPRFTPPSAANPMDSAPAPAAPATPAGPSEKDLYLLRLARGVGSSTVARERKRDHADAQHAAGTAVSTETAEPEAVAEVSMTPETVEMPRVDEVAAGQEPEVTGVSVETPESAPVPAAIDEDEPLPGGETLEPGTAEVAGVESGDPIIAGYEEEPAAGGTEGDVEEPVSVQPEDGDETAPDFLSGAGQASSRPAAGDHRNISALIGDDAGSDAAEEDYRSHYDLGMAYMEMDLLGEAIREYQIASRSPQFQVKCLEMIGLCFIRQDKPQLAIRQLTRGLAMIDTDSEDSLGMKYNLGLAYEMVGELARARTQFEDVYVVDVTFRDVAEKVARLADAS